MIRRIPRLLRAIAVVAFVVIVAAACSSPGHPEAYDDQIDPETGLSNVEQNWLEGCEVQFGTDLAQDANGICACSYSRIKDEIPFAEFVEADNRLANDPKSLQDTAAEGSNSTERRILDIVAACIADSG